MNTEQLFEYCSRNKIRVTSSKGLLCPEQLWDIRLEGGPLNLDDLYKSVNKRIRETEEESFLNKSKPTDKLLQVQLELLKHIMTVKLKEAEDRANLAKRKAEKQELLDVLADIEKQERSSLSKEEVLKRLEEL